MILQGPLPGILLWWFFFAGVACALASVLRSWYAGLSPIGRRAGQLLLVVTALMPALVIGYGYMSQPVVLTRWRQSWPLFNDLFYTLLVLFHILPVVLLIRVIGPQVGLGDSAVFLAVRFGGAMSRLDRLGCWLQGRCVGWLLAFGIGFVLMFSEFEMASRLNVNSWPVRLFDSQAGGVHTRRLLMMAFGPVLVQLCLLMACLVLWYRASARSMTISVRSGVVMTVVGWLIVVSGWLVVVVVPVVVVCLDAGTTVGRLLVGLQSRPSLLRELVAGLIFATIGGLGAWSLAGLMVSCHRRLICRLLMPVCVGLGLLGPLVVGIGILKLLAGLHQSFLLDSPLPALAGLIVVLMPAALLLRLLVDRLARDSADHAAVLLRQGSVEQRRLAGRLIWHRTGRRRFWALMCLWTLGWFDLTISAILAPARMRTIFVTLYQLMHYERIQILSAMVLLAICVPALAAALAWLVRRMLGVWLGYG